MAGLTPAFMEAYDELLRDVLKRETDASLAAIGMADCELVWTGAGPVMFPPGEDETPDGE